MRLLAPAGRIPSKRACCKREAWEGLEQSTYPGASACRSATQPQRDMLRRDQHGRPDPPAYAGELPSGAELNDSQGRDLGTRV